jgi:hypothetical protein
MNTTSRARARACVCIKQRWVGPLSPRQGVSSGCGWRKVLRLRRVVANILNKLTTRGGPPAWGLGVGLKTPQRKKFVIVAKCLKTPGTWTEFLARRKNWKKDMRFGTSSVGSDLRETGIDRADLIQLAQDRV